MARAGANVACFDLPTSGGLDETISQIEGLGKKALRLTGNVTSAADLQQACDQLQADFGHLEVAVNCAGIANATPAEEMPLEQWQQMMDVNLTGVFLS